MKKKILLIIIMLILCAGCKAKYSIRINKDDTVEETLIATEPPEFYDEYAHTSTGLVISRILSLYSDQLNEKKYNVTSDVYVNMDSGVTVRKKYDNFKEYVGNSIIYSQFTDNIDYKEENDTVTIYAKGKFTHSEQNQDIIPVDEGKITIVVPYKVEESNADKVEGNKYIWNFNEEDEEEREIKLVYTKSKIKNMNIDYSVIIVIAVLIILAIASIIVCKKFNTSRKEANKL